MIRGADVGELAAAGVLIAGMTAMVATTGGGDVSVLAGLTWFFGITAAWCVTYVVVGGLVDAFEIRRRSR